MDQVDLSNITFINSNKANNNENIQQREIIKSQLSLCIVV